MSAFRSSMLASIGLAGALCGCGDAPAPAAARPAALSTPYLFGLSERQIVQLRDRYRPRADLDGMKRQLTAPFDCAQFGDLCPEVGRERAERVVESVVLAGVRGLGADALGRLAQTEVERAADEYLAATMPEEISDDSPYFGQAPSEAPVLCNGPAVKIVEGRKVRVTARIFQIVVAAYGRAKVIHFERRPSGKWRRARASQLEIEGKVEYQSDPAFPTITLPLYERKEDVKQVTAGHPQVDIGFMLYAQGCGGTAVGAALSACACRVAVLGSGGGAPAGPLDPADEGDFGSDF